MFLFRSNILVQGCILNLKFIFPPFFLFIFFPQMKFPPQGKNLQPFFAILKILSQLGKRYAYFLPIGGKKWIFPPFFIPFQSFFFPNMLFGYIFAPPKQKNIHPQNKKYDLKLEWLFNFNEENSFQLSIFEKIYFRIKNEEKKWRNLSSKNFWPEIMKKQFILHELYI